MNEAALRARSLTLADGQVVVPIEDVLALAATPSGEATGRWEAVKQAPRLSDLRDAFCWAMDHEHLADDETYCHVGRGHAYRIREALIARYQYLAATPSEEATGHDHKYWHHTSCPLDESPHWHLTEEGTRA